MVNEKRLIDVNVLEMVFKETKMSSVFPNWANMNIMAKCAVIEFAKKVKSIVTNAPTVDAVEVVHAMWNFDAEWWEYVCSNCRRAIGNTKTYPYCPHCGAKMDGGNEDG